MSVASSCRVFSVQVGLPKAMTYLNPRDDEESQWTSGIFKHPAAGPTKVGYEGLDGDGQSDLRAHGGQDRAVLMFNKTHYAHWEREFDITIPPGGFGENLTVIGPAEPEVCLGDRWSCRDLVLEVSQPRLPCFKLGRRLQSPELVEAVMKSQQAGWYCRVIHEGTVQAGDVFTLDSRPYPQFNIERAFNLYIDSKNSRDALAELLSVSHLSALWKDRIAKIVASQ